MGWRRIEIQVNWFINSMQSNSSIVPCSIWNSQYARSFPLPPTVHRKISVNTDVGTPRQYDFSNLYRRLVREVSITQTDMLSSHPILLSIKHNDILFLSSSFLLYLNHSFVFSRTDRSQRSWKFLFMIILVATVSEVENRTYRLE